MLVKKLTIKNFRNYNEEVVSFCPERNVIIGENAQGKTNLLEAIEYASRGRSYRTHQEAELILQGASEALVEVEFVARNYDQKITICLRRKGDAALNQPQKTEKLIKLNGVPKGNTRGLKGHLVTVGFKSQDMSLIRGGPSDRRDWIDELSSTLSTGFRTLLNRYEKAVTQRNRLLKLFFEKGRLTGSDIDQLKVWDQQLATMGATIIKQRIKSLKQAIPIAEEYQEKISGSREKLSAHYHFHVRTNESQDFGCSDLDDRSGYQQADTISIEELDELELANKLLQLYQQRRADEIARRQTLTGPHRDDVRFALNDKDATAFGSQGQQRSLVIALKLSELKLISDFLEEPPVLMLDDVMAELDLRRQGFLMESVDRGMQTLITTTHLDGFEKEWLAGATLISVVDGAAVRQESLAPAMSTLQ
ncbi:MAG: DNA replication/repair protein RecF [Candidatus Obscuribacterales bacterium]|nr:DNA replication/repair protein RecF [Candidatus Obscuribacterales bacterium]